MVYHVSTAPEDSWRCKRHAGSSDACERTEWLEPNPGATWRRGDKTPCPACVGLTRTIEVMYYLLFCFQTLRELRKMGKGGANSRK